MISRSIFCVEERMKPIASGRSSRDREPRASAVTICGASASASVDQLAAAAWSPASSSLVKPMTLTSGERRSWLTM